MKNSELEDVEMEEVVIVEACRNKEAWAILASYGSHFNTDRQKQKAVSSCLAL